MNTKTKPIYVAIALLAFACIAVLPTAQAVSPPPDGAYSGANTAEGGSGTLFSLTTGSNNTAIGSEALFSVTDGVQNTAVGAQALKDNIDDANTAVGFQALPVNTEGKNNTATGWRVMFKNVNGDSNTAVGSAALYNNKGGDFNTAVGDKALQNSTGDFNIALGDEAGGSLISGSGNIYIGNRGNSNEELTIRIGNPSLIGSAFIAGISGVAVSGTGVVVDAGGQLGVAPSSARFKKDVKPMDNASEAILGLKPVSFHYKKDVDPAGASQFGLVAEEVEKVNPDLVVHDKEGKPFTVRYDAVNAMLLNEFLKEHRKVEQMQKQIEALTAGIQKVSAQLEVSKPAPHMAAENP